MENEQKQLATLNKEQIRAIMDAIPLFSFEYENEFGFIYFHPFYGVEYLIRKDISIEELMKFIYNHAYKYGIHTFY